MTPDTTLGAPFDAPTPEAAPCVAPPAAFLPSSLVAPLMTRRTLLRQAAILTGGAIVESAMLGCSLGSQTHPATTTTETYSFPTGFLWGAATSAYQIEGAAREDGRGESIWDRFSHTLGKIVDGSNGDVADDHYHRWQDDLDLMQSLGVRSYRFSVAWPRILPTGAGAVNAKGLDFYRRLVDGLLQRNIEPMVTLFHWDLPQALQDIGGWENRDVAQRFAEYADVVYRALGDKAHSWLTLNEPKTVTTVGYIYGTHAPGFHDPQRAYVALHHMLLGHGLAVQAFRARYPDAEHHIGAALNLSPVYPADAADGTAQAVTLQDGFENRLYLDPILHRQYPPDVTAALAGVWPSNAVIQPGDLATIGTSIDQLGVNYYNPLVVTAGPQVVNGVHPTTVASWESIYPTGLYDLLLRLKRDYGDLPLYITENGAPYQDTLNADSSINDSQRLSYLHDHLVAASRAAHAGVALRGYHVWSLLDNFEWA
ncbi:MAG: GH1 family beta-glucosidase, partial [Ktedonobacterales bacterium]